MHQIFRANKTSSNTFIYFLDKWCIVVLFIKLMVFIQYTAYIFGPYLNKLLVKAENTIPMIKRKK